MTHGTITAYVYFKCRCTTCRLNWNAYHTRYRNARRDALRCVKCQAPTGGFSRCPVCRKDEAKAA